MSILQLLLIKLFQLRYIVMELFFSLLQFYSDFTAFCVSRFWICARFKQTSSCSSSFKPVFKNTCGLSRRNLYRICMSKSSALLCILKDISLYTVLRFLLTDKRTSQLIQRKESFEKSLFAVAKFLFLSFGKKFLFLEVKKKKKEQIYAEVFKSQIFWGRQMKIQVNGFFLFLFLELSSLQSFPDCGLRRVIKKENSVCFQLEV